jgi:hypothetical protein
MNSLKLITLEALLVLVFLACNNGKKDETIDHEVHNKVAAVDKGSIEAMSDSGADKLYKPRNEDDKEQKHKTAEKIDWDKKIVKTANMNLEVKNYAAFNTKLRETVKQFGGYISQEEQNESAYKIENSLEFKVPVDQFDNAVNALTASGGKIIEKKITSEDVTVEVVDTKSRIEAKKQARLRYLEFLKQAKNMDEVLQVQSEINDIQEELESADGRLTYLNHSSAFSTINLNFFQVLDISAVNEPEPTFMHKVKEAFNNGWQSFAAIFIALVSLWPLLIVALLAVVLYKRRKGSKVKVA